MKLEPLRDRSNDPINISDRAIDNLKFIRETMERSTSFTAVPGYGGVLMGVTALGAAFVANSQTSIRGWLFVWLTEAALAAVIGLFAMWQKSRISKSSLLSGPAKKLLVNSLPPILCGVFITLGLWRFGHFEVMIPVWICATACRCRLRRRIFREGRSGDGLVLSRARRGGVLCSARFRKHDDGSEFWTFARRFRMRDRKALRRLVWG
ncbi:MAG: hypothetical protein IPK58_03800 [Acidobacteria bacterium]|nr:hypothetical protein [Acidobacteriota bacterium]